MTQKDWNRLKEFIDDHYVWFTWVVSTGMIAIFGLILVYDQLLDGNPCKYGYLDNCKKGVDQGASWGIAAWSGLASIGTFVFTVVTLPLNNLIVRLRRRDFVTGEKRPSRRELKVKNRERQAREAITAVRQRENELGLEHYDFGPIGNK